MSGKALTVAGRVREARSVYNSRLRGDVAGMRGRVVGRVRLSGRDASTAGAAASAGMSLLTNRCWPCRPVFWKIQTGGDVRILSVDEEGGRADNLRKISVHHTSTELQETFKPSNAKRVCSHFYWPIIFCTTNSSRVPARERWQTFENS